MFSETVQRILANPSHLGPLEGATRCGAAGTPGEGAYMRVWLEILDGETGRRGDGENPGAGEWERERVGEGVITRAAFKTFGCPSAVACGSMMCTLITGMEVEKVKLITAADLLLILGGLPEGKEFCADLAVGAVRDALGC